MLIPRVMLAFASVVVAIPQSFVPWMNHTVINTTNSSSTAIGCIAASIGPETITVTANCSYAAGPIRLSTIFLPIFDCPTPSGGQGDVFTTQKLAASPTTNDYYPFQVISGSTVWLHGTPPSAASTVFETQPATIFVEPVPGTPTLEFQGQESASVVTITSTSHVLVTVISVIGTASGGSPESVTLAGSDETLTITITATSNLATTTLTISGASPSSSTEEFPLSVNPWSFFTDDVPSETLTAGSPEGSRVTSSLPFSTDGRCGAGFNTICLPGVCCSAFGWCGIDFQFCGPGCLQDFSNGFCSESQLGPLPGNNVSVTMTAQATTVSQSTASTLSFKPGGPIMNLTTVSSFGNSASFPFTTTYLTTVELPHSIEIFTTTKTVTGPPTLVPIKSNATFGTLHLSTAIKNNTAKHGTSVFHNATITAPVDSISPTSAPLFPNSTSSQLSIHRGSSPTSLPTPILVNGTATSVLVNGTFTIIPISASLVAPPLTSISSGSATDLGFNQSKTTAIPISISWRTASSAVASVSQSYSTLALPHQSGHGPVVFPTPSSSVTASVSISVSLLRSTTSSSAIPVNLSVSVSSAAASSAPISTASSETERLTLSFTKSSLSSRLLVSATTQTAGGVSVQTSGSLSSRSSQKSSAAGVDTSVSDLSAKTSSSRAFLLPSPEASEPVIGTKATTTSEDSKPSTKPSKPNTVTNSITSSTSATYGASSQPSDTDTTLPKFTLSVDTTSDSYLLPTAAPSLTLYTPTPQTGDVLQADPTGEFNLFPSGARKRNVGQNGWAMPRFEIVLPEEKNAE